MAEATEIPINDFLTDAHRRVCANLSQPRTVFELAMFLTKHDPPVFHEEVAYQGVDLASFDPAGGGDVVAGAKSLLADLEAEGLVKNLGPISDVTAALALIEQDGELADIPKEKAANLVERAEHAEKLPVFGGKDDFYIFTAYGLAKLKGPIPQEPPPMVGARLAAAEAEPDTIQSREEAEEAAKES